MATSMAVGLYYRKLSPCCFTAHQQIRSSKPDSILLKLHSPSTRRSAAATLVTAFLATEAFTFIDCMVAQAFDFRLTVPDETPEEAYSLVKVHARELLEIKPLIDSQSWREAQIQLRQSSPKLKQDLYTIIQAKPGSQRPQLRKLYSYLFNNVTKLDYAARAKDGNTVQECYSNIVEAIYEMFLQI